MCVCEAGKLSQSSSESLPSCVMPSSIRDAPTLTEEAQAEEEDPCSPSSSILEPPLLHSPSPPREGEEAKNASMPFCHVGVGHGRAEFPPINLLPFLPLLLPGETAADLTGASCFLGALATTAARRNRDTRCECVLVYYIYCHRLQRGWGGTLPFLTAALFARVRTILSQLQIVGLANSRTQRANSGVASQCSIYRWFGAKLTSIAHAQQTDT